MHFPTSSTSIVCIFSISFSLSPPRSERGDLLTPSSPPPPPPPTASVDFFFPADLWEKRWKNEDLTRGNSTCREGGREE